MVSARGKVYGLEGGDERCVFEIVSFELGLSGFVLARQFVVGYD